MECIGVLQVGLLIPQPVETAATPPNLDLRDQYLFPSSSLCPGFVHHHQSQDEDCHHCKNEEILFHFILL